LPLHAGLRHDPTMIEDARGSAREQRLAAQLRENLKRRKAQARALALPRGDDAEPSDPGCEPLPKAHPPV
jgi:hypothetical protein